MKLEIKDLHKSYGNIRALAGVSLSLTPGRILGVLGPNGCGKSTLIKNILGLSIPDSGDIFLNQRSILGQCEHRNEIGYMPQNPQFPSNLKVNEIFSMLQDIRQQQSSRLYELIHLFGLTLALGQRFQNLSGGTKQKISIVVAFMFNPHLLILDEPTVGLDPLAASGFKKLLSQERTANKSILLVNHILSETEVMADDIAFLLDGKILFNGPKDLLIQNHGQVPFSNLEEAIVDLMQSSAVHDIADPAYSPTIKNGLSR